MSREHFSNFAQRFTWIQVQSDWNQLVKDQGRCELTKAIAQEVMTFDMHKVKGQIHLPS